MISSKRYLLRRDKNIQEVFSQYHQGEIEFQENISRRNLIEDILNKTEELNWKHSRFEKKN